MFAEPWHITGKYVTTIHQQSIQTNNQNILRPLHLIVD